MDVRPVTPLFMSTDAEPPLRIAGTVTDTAGRPLVRRVLLYDSALTQLAEAWSDAAGHVEFTVRGANGHNLFVARAIGALGECDDISCRVRGVAVTT